MVVGIPNVGKSSLINSVLYRTLAKELNRAITYPGKVEQILGLEHLDKVIAIDQSPIGRTPRSNPATYTGMFTDIRKIFAAVPEAREKGYKEGRFSLFDAKFATDAFSKSNKYEYLKLNYEMTKPVGEGNFVITNVRAMKNATIDRATLVNAGAIIPNTYEDIKKVYNDIEVGEFYTFKDGNEIVISDKYQEDNKFYFEYKYVNQDAKTIKDLINDEHYTVTVKQFAQLVKHYGRK